MKGKLRVFIKSDTCFSNPTTASIGVDIECAVDELGLPRIAGKTIHGLLRDTWLSARSGIDKLEVGYQLLGAPKELVQSGLLRIGDASIETDVRQWLKWALRRSGNPLPVDATSTAFFAKRTMTAIERSTGTAATETLRMVRVIPKGIELVADIEAFTDLSADAKSLLDVLCSLTRHVGLHRNRGFGHVQLSVEWDRPTTAQTQVSFNVTPHNHTIFHHYSLKLQAPCIISAPEIDPNMRTTLSYITGSAIRGAVAVLLQKDGMSDAEIGDIIGSGRVRFLNAYVETDTSARSVPRAVTWRRKKDPGLSDSDHDSEASDDALDIINRQGTEPRVPLSFSYFGLSDSTLSPSIVKLQQTTHQARNRATGVTRKDNGSSIFVYESLEAGQTFRGCIATDAVDSQLAVRTAKVLSNGPLWLGRSRHSQYGASAIVEFQGNATASETNFKPLIYCDDDFEVILTSDALLRDQKTGQHDPFLLKSEIARRYEGRAEAVEALVKTGVASGFNTLWRTELPAASCASVGSVVVLRAMEDIEPSDALILQGTPIGERTAEGFGCFITRSIGDGRIAVDVAPVVTAVEPKSVGVPEVLQQAQRRLYRERIRILTSTAAMSLANEINPLPSRSLIGRLRTPLRDNSEWRQSYALWLRGQAYGGLADSAIRALREARSEELSLLQILRAACNADESDGSQWRPDAGTYTQAAMSRYRIVEEAVASKIWDELRAESDVWYIDTLLASIARRKEESDAHNDDA